MMQFKKNHKLSDDLSNNCTILNVKCIITCVSMKLITSYSKEFNLKSAHLILI